MGGGGVFLLLVIQSKNSGPEDFKLSGLLNYVSYHSNFILFYCNTVLLLLA